jgi:hypothetical protein
MYNLFIGRYQSPHVGHQVIFSTYLEKGLPILIAIRDTPTDEKNPLTAEQVKGLWEKIYADEPLVKVIIIPDIASVNYGRGVGYEVKEIKVSKIVGAISATDIREQIRKGERRWMMDVDNRIWQDLKTLFTDEPSK